jgi:membrane protease YdiL (CAAX protease family)
VSLAALLVRSIGDLAFAILIGAGVAGGCLYAAEGRLGVLCGMRALGLPVSIEKEASKWHHRDGGHFDLAPDDDAALHDWYRKQPGIEEITIEDLTIARGSPRHIKVRFRGSKELANIRAPFEQLGYFHRTSWQSTSWSPMAFMPDERELLLIELGCLQVGLILVGTWRCARTRWRIGKLPRSERTTAALLTDCVVFLALLGGFVWLYEQALRRWIGPPRMTSGPLGALLGLSNEWSVGSGIPDETRTIAAVLFIAAVSFGQELFFRAGIFGMWQRAGFARSGAIVSALAFAALTLDPYHVPATIVVGLGFAWLFARFDRSSPSGWRTWSFPRRRLECSWA